MVLGDCCATLEIEESEGIWIIVGPFVGVVKDELEGIPASSPIRRRLLSLRRPSPVAVLSFSTNLSGVVRGGPNAGEA